MTKSPIERLVDDACGYKHNQGISVDMEIVDALTALADAAVAWTRVGNMVGPTDVYEAAVALKELGWDSHLQEGEQ